MALRKPPLAPPEQWPAAPAPPKRPTSSSRPAPPPRPRDARGFSRSPCETSRQGKSQWTRRPAAPGNSAAPPPPAACPARPAAPRNPGRRASCPACGPSPFAARPTRDRPLDRAARPPGLPAVCFSLGRPPGRRSPLVGPCRVAASPDRPLRLSWGPWVSGAGIQQRSRAGLVMRGFWGFLQKSRGFLGRV